MKTPAQSVTCEQYRRNFSYTLLKAFAALSAGVFLTMSPVKADENITRLPAVDSEMLSAYLYDTLKNRHSAAGFSDKELSLEQLATLMWAGCGISRPAEGKITAPSALNKQDILLYALKHDGAWLYQPRENTIQKVSDKDLVAAAAGPQKNFANAPLIFLLVSQTDLLPGVDAGLIDAGHVAQNLLLAATSMNLGSRVRMTMDKETLKQELKLSNAQLPILNVVVGEEK